MINCTAGDSLCKELFELDKITYSVPIRWCGQRIDSTQLADTEKLVRLPDEYSHKDYRLYLNLEARDAFVKMGRAAGKDSARLVVQSSYRSARYQRVIINRRLAKNQTMDTILKYVAPPGYSEHETGRAVDLVWTGGQFEKSAAYEWLKKNGSDFKFIESIPEDSTGQIPWEPWHWLYTP